MSGTSRQSTAGTAAWSRRSSGRCQSGVASPHRMAAAPATRASSRVSVAQSKVTSVHARCAMDTSSIDARPLQYKCARRAHFFIPFCHNENTKGQGSYHLNKMITEKNKQNVCAYKHVCACIHAIMHKDILSTYTHIRSCKSNT